MVYVTEFDNATHYTLVDDDYDGEYISTLKLNLNRKKGYVIYYENGKTKYLHKLICKTNKGYYVDHINRIKVDNRSCNLREATPSQNRVNSKDVIRSSQVSKKQKYLKKLAYNRNWYRQKRLANK